MISKERLQELIEQGATIYYVVNNEICSLELTFRHNIYLAVEGCFICLYGDKGLQIYDNRIFETKEDAEWNKEFGCIERTERLNITDWQKFKNRDENFGFTVEDYSYKCFTDGIEIELVEFWGQGGRSLFKAPLTKENYTLACRKCKEIFLGDKEQ